MAKITKKVKQERETVIVSTKAKIKAEGVRKWWGAKTGEERATQVIESAGFLKEMSQYKYRQASMYARMYNNMPLYGVMGGSLTSNSGQASQLPVDRPTMNVVQSCIDTLISRISQARPRPVFLTDNGDYKARNLAKQLNQFIAGEMHQTDAYKKVTTMLMDAAVLGTGILKVYEKDAKVALQRVLATELLVDSNDSMFGDPRQMYQVALVDRDVLAAAFGSSKVIDTAEQAYPDHHSESTRTISDQVMVVEGWHLPSGPGVSDGRHILAVSSGSLVDEAYTKEKFPFIFLHYAPRLLGFWGQPLTEQLMGTQLEINKLLATISASINLVGVPRVFVEDGSKVVKAHLNNQIGAIVTYRGTKPQYEVAPCVPAEIYAQLQRLVDYAYQQSGISALAAASQKPAGLNAAVALREYDDLQSDRFAALVKRFDAVFIDFAYQAIDLAREIAERDGSYQTIYPNKDGTREIDLPEAKLLDNPFVIQCFDASALPRDPAGRMQKVTEMMQAGMIDVKEGRRLLDFPDLQQNEKLDNASEERILQILDEIVEKGKYTPPDPFMNLTLAFKLSQDYYNLYVPAKLEESKAEKLRTFNSQVLALQQAAMPPAPPAMPQGAPQAVPETLPTSDQLPRVA